jgi:enhancer of polycomb-like protein
MSTEDDLFLKEYNKSRPGNDISEDVFEQIMFVFEDTAAEHTPHAAIDKTVLQFEPFMRQALNHQMMDDKLLVVAKDFYEFWKKRRQENDYDSLQPKLKFETSPDSDDGDPYVCFRRREVRQTRKTRARDVQSTEKLKKLRKELEEGRNIVKLVELREQSKGNLIHTEIDIFESRTELKAIKRKTGIKADDDELLINQKVCHSQPTFGVITDKNSHRGGDLRNSLASLDNPETRCAYHLGQMVDHLILNSSP